MQINITQKQLAKLLRDAEEAHADYEKTIEGTDDNWADWYSSYIMDELRKPE